MNENADGNNKNKKQQNVYEISNLVKRQKSPTNTPPTLALCTHRGFVFPKSFNFLFFVFVTREHQRATAATIDALRGQFDAPK